MGVIRFYPGVEFEWNTVKVAAPNHAAFLIARLARVAEFGADEAFCDRGRNGIYVFPKSRVCVIYALEAENAIDPDVVALAFGNLKDERIAAVRARALSRLMGDAPDDN